MKINNFKIVIFYFSLYLLLVCLSHLLLLTLISFFHFLLDHSLAIIEAWIFERGHEIIICSKALAFFIMLKILNIQTEHASPIKYILKHSKVLPPKKILAIIFFMFFFCLIWGHPQMAIQTELSFFKMISSYIGTICFYFSDVLIFLFLQKLFSCNRKDKILQICIFSVLTYLVTRFSFIYIVDININIILHFIFSFYLVSYLRLNWTVPLCYFVFFVAPLASFFGEDFVWGTLHSPMIFRNALDFHIYFVLILVSFSYLNFSRIFKKKG